MSDLNIPTNKEERTQLKAMIVEMTHCLSKIDAQREHMKEIAGVAAEEFGLEKKLINKLARTMFKNNYASLHAENEHFEFLYEALVDGKITPGD
jgi:hypothetical protein